MSSFPSLALASSPPSSSPSSPFSSLPTELVQHVLNLTVTHTYHSTTYPSRQAELRSLCLVSKLFRHIAQPLLFSLVVLSHHHANFKALASRSGSKGAIRTAVFSASSHQTLERSLEVPLPFLRHLTVSYQPYSLNTENIGEINLEWLHALSEHLVTLQLSSVDINVGQPLVFKSLERLALSWCQGDLVNLLDPRILPALSAFALCGSLDHPEEGHLNVFSIKNSVFDQLEILSLDNFLVDELDVDFVEKHGTSLLIDLSNPPYRVPSSRKASSARACCFVPDDNLVDEIDLLTDSLEDGTTFRTIYVPAGWESLQAENEEVKASNHRLEKRMQELNIELVSELQPNDWAKDPVFSEEFIRRRRVSVQKEKEGNR